MGILRKEMINFAVQAVILDKEGNVLCVSRKDNHNDFGLPGGKVDDTDLSTEDAIKREVLEETGLIIDMDSAFMIFAMHRSKYMGYTYLITDWSGVIETNEPHIVKWGTFGDISKGSFGSWNTLVTQSLESLGVNIKK